MGASLLSGILGLVRTKYIAYVFGAGSVTDAYNAAFNLPDMISYFLVGGVASITLVNILSRYREAGDDAGADLALSAVLNAMMLVLGAGILLAEIIAPVYTRLLFPRLAPETAALCTHLDAPSAARAVLLLRRRGAGITAAGAQDLRLPGDHAAGL